MPAAASTAADSPAVAPAPAAPLPPGDGGLPLLGETLPFLRDGFGFVAILLLRGYNWELAPGQDLDYDWSLNPPEPKDGLRARLRRR